MSLDFPNAPSNGDISLQDNGVTYQWEAAKERWNSITSADGKVVAGTVVQVVEIVQSVGALSTSNNIPADNTPPQITEGGLALSLSITPKFADSTFRIDFNLPVGPASGGWISDALFINVEVNSICSAAAYVETATAIEMLGNTTFISTGTLDPILFTLRFGAAVGVAQLGVIHGGVDTGCIVITEIQPNAVTVPAPTDPVISTGMVAPFAVAAGLPWLFCDGAAVNRVTYANLFNVIGESYGNGDGSTTFNLPDYRGEFLRGQDAGAGVDPDAAGRTDRGDGTTGDNVGTKQADGFENHNHPIAFGSGDGAGQALSRAANLVADENSWVRDSTDAGAGTETRPINTYVRYYIYSGLNAASIPAPPETPVSYWAFVNSANGAIYKGNGLTCVKNLSIFTITLDTPFPDDNYSVMVCVAQNTIDSTVVFDRVTQTASSFDIRTGNANQGITDRDFSVVVTRYPV